ncbi:VanW family protein [Nocardioides sp. SR21]|uniref:VanW family protein n=1 Tax=Nocardioides sp. SR21 TaxID=2919501 RepID=UPI001FA9DF57|nr:VanW family protein [Nocardioides sp. SR21]
MTPSQRHPWLRPAAIRAHRARRRWHWLRSGADWATTREPDLAERLVHHSSPLLRELEGVPMVLQHNKVTNLRLASARVDGLVLRPGETFSFNRVVGNCTRRKGYVDGLRFVDGEVGAGVGGGICQLANLLHWLVLHSALTVVERSEHSLDLFPDSGRVVPWGVGCTIVYNYVDLVVRNDTAATYQLRVRVGEQHLRGELRSDRMTPVTYRVEAREDRFVDTASGDVRRVNEIWRTTIDRHTGASLGEELVRRNDARVRYVPTRQKN